jgi:hypothetical protein
VIPEDVKVVCAQLSKGVLTYLVVNGEKMVNYWVFIDKMTSFFFTFLFSPCYKLYTMCAKQQ